MTKTRFCPSPTGSMHLGNARTALFNALLARHDQGVFLLRIEDTDQTRSEDQYVQALFEDLRWLGLDWQEGEDVGGKAGPYAQSKRSDIYASYYQQLLDQGQAYWCFCSEQQLAMNRKVQLANGKPPRYPGTCCHLQADEIQSKRDQGINPSLRFKIPDEGKVSFVDLVRGQQTFLCADIGDFIIQRSDGSSAFMFCNAVDDALMGVTHALRGEDHLTNTPRQIMIMTALGLTVPQYGHISLIVGADGSPLSKRHGSKSLQALREQGFHPQAIQNYLARLGHYYESDALMNLDELSLGFRLTSLGQAPARFDYPQLLYWQKSALAGLDDKAFSAWAKGHVSSCVPKNKHQEFLILVRPNVVLPADIDGWSSALFAKKCAYSEHAQGLLQRAGSEFFQHCLDAFGEMPDDYEGALVLVKQRAQVQGKDLFKPLRVALTGREAGPELPSIMALMGAELVSMRFKQALAEARSQE